MKILQISVVNKIATYQKRCGYIVCGNSDYQIAFTFDSEWNSFSKKTARFIVNGKYTDVEFTGTTCAVPIISNADKITVGVYAGDLCTTTPATITCKASILCGAAIRTSDVETEKYYASQAEAAAKRAESAAGRAEAAAKKAESSAGGLDAETEARISALEEALDSYITEVDTLIGGDS